MANKDVIYQFHQLTRRIVHQLKMNKAIAEIEEGQGQERTEPRPAGSKDEKTAALPVLADPKEPEARTLVTEPGMRMNDQSEDGSPREGRGPAKLPAPVDHLQGRESWELEQPPFDYVSRWEDPDAFARRKGWGPEQGNRSYQEPGEKYFTAQAFSYLPLFEKTAEEIEILIRKHRVDDLTKRLVL